MTRSSMAGEGRDLWARATPAVDGFCRLVPWLMLAMPPFFVLGRSFGEGVLGLVCLAFLLRMWQRRDAAPFRERWFLVSLALWAWLCAIAPFAAEPYPALESALLFGRFPLFGLALQHWLFADAAFRRRFAIVVGLTISWVLVDCWVQAWRGTSLFGTELVDGVRLTGPFDRHVPGTFMAKIFFIAWSFWGAVVLGRGGSRDWRRLAVFVLAPVPVMATILVAGERAAFLTFTGGIGLALILLPELRRFILPAALALVLAAGAVTLASERIHGYLVQRTINDVEDFWQDRYGQIFRTAFGVWRMAPVVGVGPKQYRVHCADESLAAIGPVHRRCVTHPHNPYLEWLSEAGLIGLAGFLVFLGTAAARVVGAARQAGDAARIALTLTGSGLALVFLFPFLPGMAFNTTWNGLLFWQLFGWLMAWTRETPADDA